MARKTITNIPALRAVPGPAMEERGAGGPCPPASPGLRSCGCALPSSASALGENHPFGLFHMTALRAFVAVRPASAVFP